MGFHNQAPTPTWARPLLYGALNIASASGIVFANKTVFSKYGFKFTCALTWIHTLFTLVGMRLFLRAGLFQYKQLPQLKLLPLAAAYVGYIVLCNLSLNINTVGFYQVMKIAVAPTVMVLDLLLFRTIPPIRVVLSVFIVCIGIGIATVTDDKIISNFFGLAVGMAATLVTALYQIWAGTLQTQLKASSTQLLHQYTPQAALLLGLLIPIMEPVGRPGSSDPGTLLGYKYTPAAVAAIIVSAFLGLLVSLSTFLVIGCTSTLTYNIVGHLKTIIILTGGVLFFDESMPLDKLFGVLVAMAGIIWYTHLKLVPSSSRSNEGSSKQGHKESPLPSPSAAAQASTVNADSMENGHGVAHAVGSRHNGGGGLSSTVAFYKMPTVRSTQHAAQD